jgi:hypothetical protein
MVGRVIFLYTRNGDRSMGLRIIRIAILGGSEVSCVLERLLSLCYIL